MLSFEAIEEGFDDVIGMEYMMDGVDPAEQKRMLHEIGVAKERKLLQDEYRTVFEAFTAQTV